MKKGVYLFPNMYIELQQLVREHDLISFQVNLI